MLNERFAEIVRQPDAPFVNAGVGQGRLVRTTETFSLAAAVQVSGIQRGLEGLLSEAERVRRFGFTATELARQKSAVLKSIDTQYAERDKTESGSLASRFVDHFLTDDPVLGIETRAPFVKAILPGITLAEVNAIAGEWLVDRNRVVLASSPLQRDVVIPTDSALRAVIARAPGMTVTAWVDNTGSAAIVAQPPAGGRIVSERFIDALGTTEWMLSNGIRVLVKTTNFKSDEILIAGVSLGGVGGVAPEKYFSARLGPMLLERGGAGTNDATQLAKLLTGKSAGVSAELDDRSESVSGQTSPGDLDTFFEVMWAKTQTPRLDSAAVYAVKQQYRAFVQNRGNEPGAVYNDTIGATMSQHHPLGRPVTASIVDSLDGRIALEVFRDRFSDFSDFTFVIVGATTPALVKPYVEKWIASLPGGGRREIPRDPGMRPPTGHVTKTIRKGAEPKAQTSIILTGNTAWSPAVALRAAAISEILSVRMRETLREDLGGTYGVAVGTSVERWPVERFATSVSFGSAPERADSLAGVAMQVMRRFASDGPTSDELSKVKENLLRTREAGMRQNEFWVYLLQQQVLWGDDPADALQNFAGRVKALDASSVRALARIVLDETNLARFTLLPESR
jgi:zinc protease